MKNLKIIILLLQLPVLLFSLSNDKSFIDQYTVRHWSTKNGLAQNSISSITQDNKDYIWFGTQNGFSRFNGLKFETFNYKNIPKIKSDNIVHINIDKNNIWVSSKKGLLLFIDKNNSKLFTKKDGLYSDIISLSYTNKDNTWVGTSNGLNLIKNNKIIDFEGSFLLKDKYIYSIIQAENNALYIGTSNGLYIIKDNIIDEIKYKNKSIKVFQFLKRKNGSLLFSSWSKIFILKDKKIKEFKTELKLKLKPALLLLEDSSENIWIASRVKHLLIRLTKDDKITYFNISKIISDTMIRSLFEDKENNLWIGTFNNGLYLLHDTVFTTSKYQDDFLIFKAFDHKYFNNLYHKELKNTEEKNISEELKYLRSIYVEDKNTIWLALKNGIIRYKDNQIKRFNSKNSKLTKYPITSIFKDSKKRLWICDRAGNIFVYKNENEKIKQVNKKYNFKKCLISDIIEENKTIWFASDGCGIAKLKNEKLVYYSDKIKSKRIYGILKYHFLWITTKDGLYIYKNNSFYKIKSNNKHFDDELYGIIKDDLGNIWISSNRGIFLINKEEVSRLIMNKNTKIKIRQLGFDDGLKSLDFLKNQKPSLWKTQDGMIWFPSLKGISTVKPDNMIENKKKSPVYIESIKIDGEYYNKKNKIILKPSSNEIQITFSLLSFKNPKKNKFKYKLEGYNNKWIELDDKNYVSYMNLPSGEYKFRVIALSSDGVWNLKGDEFVFKKSQYFYKTLLFKFILSFLYVLFIYIVYRIRSSKLEKERKKLEEINKKLLSVDVLKDRILTNTTHELRTPLNGIIGLSESLSDVTDIDTIKYNLDIIKTSGYRLSNLINDILDFQKSKTSKLTLNIKAINLYNVVELVIKSSKYSFKDKDIILKNKISKDVLLKADEERIIQILYNLIGNSIKFTKKGEIIIYALKKGDFYEIIVKDTGIGIAKDKQSDVFNVFEQLDIENYEHYSGTGLGLSITKEIVELHGGMISLESELGIGSSFIFTIPKLSKNDYKDIKNDDLDKYDNKKRSKTGEVLNINKIKNDYTIVTIDDESINQYVLKSQLENFGYNIIQFFNGKESLEYLSKNNKPDIIILDIMMPEMSGYELCKRIRKQYNSSELPIIMLTAKVNTSDLLQGFKSGANDYIHKPFSRDELLIRIDYHLKLIGKFNKDKEELKENIESQKEEIVAINEELKTKYSNNKLSEKDINDYINIIENYIIDKKIYKDPEFSLENLSKVTKIPSHYISQVINKKLKMNFYTLINKYRVDEAIKLFNNEENKNKTILEISFLAGFKSKSTFNRVFKNTTGKTPSMYRKNI